MGPIKKGFKNLHLTCDICKIDFMTEADHALHEFSKKHCDNLLKISRNKQIITKQKTKTDWEPLEKEIVPKTAVVPQTGSFAKYGYFVPGEIYKTATVSKEFNTDYDPYLQKFAENPCKEKPITLKTNECENQTLTFNMPTSLSKKKRKKIKICQICNVTLSTVPEYDSHMKSPQHIWKLKISGMGVSAHFVKASSDLHTTDINEEPKVNQSVDVNQFPTVTLGTNENVSSTDFPSLFCDICELLLNSVQQYNAHVNGKAHIEYMQRKAELKIRKEKFKNPSPNQLYCFSCKITLNNLVQYNEHRNGKKHKIRCKQLMKEGITIPPEERLPGWQTLKNDSSKPLVYPELYEKFILEKEKNLESESSNLVKPSLNENNFLTEAKQCETSSINKNSEMLSSAIISKNSELESDNNSNVSSNENFSNKSINSYNLNDKGCVDTKQNLNITFQIDSNLENTSKNTFTSIISSEKPSAENVTDSSQPNCPSLIEMPYIISANPIDNEKPKKEDSKLLDIEVIKLSENDVIMCSICNQNFQTQSQFDVHLNTEDHLKQILQLKLSGQNYNQILNLIFSDRNKIKPDKLGRYNCSVCNVVSNNITEYNQHLSSIVHKYTLKDFKQKRTVEIKNMVESNEQGLYFCSLCKELWNSLLEFNQHLHLTKHRSTQRVERAKKKCLFLRKQRLRNNLKRKNLAQRRLKIDKNPGVRTKICGIATDTNTGAQASIPNLETLEPKIDLSKNVQLGVGKPCDSSKFKNEERRRRLFKVKNRHKKFNLKKKQQLQTVINNQNFNQNNSIPPLMSSPLQRNTLLPLNSPFQAHSTYLGSFRSSNWPPKRFQYSPKPGFFYNSPQVNNNQFVEQPWNYNNHWPGYCPSYR